MATQPTGTAAGTGTTGSASATPNGDAAAASIGADSATGSAATNPATNDKGSNASSAKESKDEGVQEFDTVASSKAWTVPANGVDDTEAEEHDKAIALQEKESAERAKNPNKIITREPVEGVGGESFDVGIGESADSLAYKVQKEDEDARREDPNRIVLRSPDKRIGGQSFDVG